MSDDVSIAVVRARAASAEAKLPMAELHCHIEGTASPALVAELARRHGVDVGDIISDGGYVWRDFTSFLAAYDRASSVFRTGKEFARLAIEHLQGLADAGTIYAEIFISPDHALAAGLTPEAYLEGLGDGLRQAHDTHGIEARIIVVGIRHLGSERVEAAASFAAAQAVVEPLLTGFGLAGEERLGRPADFARAFDTARHAGLGLTAHAGEFCGPEQIRETLDALKPTRLGHGVRAIEDASLVAEIAETGIVLEVCPGSNLALKIFPDAAAHPLRRLVEAGVKVTLNSDDPPFFATDLSSEYRFAAGVGFTVAELAGFTRNAIEAAFVDDETRKRLLDLLTLRAILLGAPGPAH